MFFCSVHSYNAFSKNSMKIEWKLKALGLNFRFWRFCPYLSHLTSESNFFSLPHHQILYRSRKPALDMSPYHFRIFAIFDLKWPLLPWQQNSPIYFFKLTGLYCLGDLMETKYAKKSHRTNNFPQAYRIC